MQKLCPRFGEKKFVTFIGRGLCAGFVYHEILSQAMELNSPLPLGLISSRTWEYKQSSSVIHPQMNEQAQSANKMIFKGIKKILMMPKDNGSSNCTKYYGCITLPLTPPSGRSLYTSIQGDIMLPVEINTSSWRHSHFNEEENKVELRCAVDLINEKIHVSHIQE